MPPKVIPIIVTASGSVKDINIADMDLQVVIMGQLQQIIDQLTGNGQVLKNKITEMGIFKIKMPLVKRFSGEKAKLKRF